MAATISRIVHAPQAITALKAIADVLLTIVIGAILFGSVIAIIQHATKTHWALGVLVTIFYCFAVFLGISDLRGHPASRYPFHKGLAIFLLTAFTAIAVAASASLLLLRAGWAISGLRGSVA